MRRVIRINYGFFYGKRYYGLRGVSVGETIEENSTENENRVSAVCHALGIDGAEFTERYGEPWGWADEDWKRAGFDFEYCEES